MTSINDISNSHLKRRRESDDLHTSGSTTEANIGTVGPQGIVAANPKHEFLSHCPKYMTDDAFRNKPRDFFLLLFPTALEQELATPIMVNTISIMHLRTAIDLRALSCSIKNAEYKTEKAPRVVLRLDEPKCVATVRSNGLVHIVGATNISASRCAAELTARIIRAALRLQTLKDVLFSVVNVHVSFDLQRAVKLDDIARNCPGASYEPDASPGCYLLLSGLTRDNDTKSPPVSWRVRCCVFVSGKCTMTGATSMRIFAEAYIKLLLMILPSMQGVPPDALDLAKSLLTFETEYSLLQQQRAEPVADAPINNHNPNESDNLMNDDDFFADELDCDY